MIKHWLILLIWMGLVINKSYAQEYLNKTYDIDTIEQFSNGGYHLINLKDGNKMIVTVGLCEGDKNCVGLIKVDNSGNLLWQQRYPNYPHNMNGGGIIENQDGTFFIFGEKTTFMSKHQLYLWKLNSFGELLWQKSFGGKENDFGRTIMRNKKNEIILFGYSQAYSDPDGGVFMRKINEEGEEIWHQDIGTVGISEDCFCPHEDIDGGYALGLFNFDISTGWISASAMKVDSLGQVIWHTDMGSISNYFNVCLVPHPLGGYWFTAQRNIQLVENQAEDHQLLLARLDTMGNVIQEIYFAGEFPKKGYPYLLKNGDLLLYGRNSDPDVLTRYFSAWLARVNPQGEILWERNYAYDNIKRVSLDIFFDVYEEADGSLLLTGSATDIDTIWVPNFMGTDSTAQLDYNGNAWLFRVTAEGCIPGEEVCEEAMFVTIKEAMLLPSNEALKVYPNPAKDQTMIVFTPLAVPTTLSIYDIRGRKLQQLPVAPQQTSLVLDVAVFNRGMYLLVLETNGRVVGQQKLIVE